MASACVNNYGCSLTNRSDPPAIKTRKPDPDFIDFEFRLHDASSIVPADELFSGGKLVPLHLSPPVKRSPETSLSDPISGSALRRRDDLIGSGLVDTFAVSPKAPTCSSRWRELLHIKRQQQQQQQQATKADPGTKNPRSSSSLIHFLNRTSRASDPSLNLPLLKDGPRLSLSLDAEHRPNRDPILLNRTPPRVGRSPVRRRSEAPPPRCASVDSPRMSASGKVVFQGLGRSSSSPSTFTGGGGQRAKHAAAVRVTPVLNVPVCSSLGRGSKSGSVFGFFSGSGHKGKN